MNHQLQRAPVHPDRLTRLSCTRCGRPVCSECMVVAPVGFQCRECVAQAAAQTQQTSGRAVPGRGAALRRPIVTYVLVGICAVAFLLSLASAWNPWSATGMRPVFIAIDGQWYRLLTSVFLHWSILHIGFNMLVLIMLGPTLEMVFGHVRFTFALRAGLPRRRSGVVLLFTTDDGVGGASGAIFGLMGALIGRGVGCESTSRKS